MSTEQDAVAAGRATMRRRRRRVTAVLAVTVAAVALAGCGAARAASPSLPKTAPQLEKALRAWSGFPVSSSPRPLVLTGQQVAGPAGGFPNGASKLAYLERAVRKPATLPAGPATAGGYPVISSRQALQVFTATAGTGPAPSARLTITRMRLGTGLFQTDRGARQLPAWLLWFAGVQDPAAVFAVAPSRIYPPPSRLSGRKPFVTAAWLGPHGRALTAEFTGLPAGTGRCTADYRLQVAVSRTAVAVIVLESAHQASGCAAVGYARSATTVLRSPLGARVVVDALTGAAVPVTKASPAS